MDLQTLTDFLASNGGWGLSAILMLVIYWLWRDKKQYMKDVSNLLENRHNQFIDILSENLKLQQSNLDIQQRVEPLLTRVEKAVEICERTGRP